MPPSRSTSSRSRPHYEPALLSLLLSFLLMRYGPLHSADPADRLFDDHGRPAGGVEVMRGAGDGFDIDRDAVFAAPGVEEGAGAGGFRVARAVEQVQAAMDISPGRRGCRARRFCGAFPPRRLPCPSPAHYRAAHVRFAAQQFAPGVRAGRVCAACRATACRAGCPGVPPAFYAP